MQHSSKKRQNQVSIRVLQGIVFALFLIFFARLAQLQIIDHETYGPLSRKNSLIEEHVHPARGLIRDRNGRLLVDNQPIYSITVTPANFRHDNIPLLAELLEKTEEEVLERILVAQEYSWQRSSRLFTEIDFKTFSSIQENIWRLPGINHQIESKRNYPNEIHAAHLLGYLREVTDEEYRNSNRYLLGDKAGRTGLEQIYEQDLRGDLGAQYLRINAYGQRLGSYENQELDQDPVKGTDIHTTLDIDLQSLAEKLMVGKVGGLVAMDPRDGAILSIVSSPQFDISRLSGRLDRDYWMEINADTTNPLFNRAISTRQPPGSTVKPMMGLIAMNMGIITPEDEIVCNGGYQRGRFYLCTDDHGSQNLEQAIQNSCNTYFYRIMDLMMAKHGLDVWSRMVMDFGLGRKNQIDLPNENQGIVPDSSYYDRIFGSRLWGIGDLISVGIGQGSFSASPLQLAVMTSSIANGGNRVRPFIVRSLSHPDGSGFLNQPEINKIPWVNKRGLDIVQSGMRKVITEGSGRWYANLSDVEVAGKTGTAQNPHGEDHGWFVSYAPFDNPEIVVAVLIENAGYGSISAAPVGSLLMEQYFDGEIKRNWILEYVLNFQPRSSDETEADIEEVIEEEMEAGVEEATEDETEEATEELPEDETREPVDDEPAREADPQAQESP
ncbi:MAG: penicillin-binding protein 2 [Balneolales bacterium]